MGDPGFRDCCVSNAKRWNSHPWARGPAARLEKVSSLQSPGEEGPRYTRNNQDCSNKGQQGEPDTRLKRRNCWLGW